MNLVGIYPKMDRIKGNSKQITDSAEIAEVLGIVKTHQWPLSYSVAAGARRVTQNTEISKIDTEKGSITVGSEVKYSEISPDETITFRAQSGGITIRFDTNLMQIGGNPLANRLFSECRKLFPRTLTYTQLRRAIRINCVDLDHIPVTFFADDGNRLEGEVADISATGAKLKFTGTLSEYFANSRSVSDCRLRLPDSNVVEVRVKILGVIQDDANGISFVRCYFLEMQEDHELKLEELITTTLRKLNRQTQV